MLSRRKTGWLARPRSSTNSSLTLSTQSLICREEMFSPSSFTASSLRSCDKTLVQSKGGGEYTAPGLTLREKFSSSRAAYGSKNRMQGWQRETQTKYRQPHIRLFRSCSSHSQHAGVLRLISHRQRDLNAHSASSDQLGHFYTWKDDFKSMRWCPWSASTCLVTLLSWRPNRDLLRTERSSSSGWRISKINKEPRDLLQSSEPDGNGCTCKISKGGIWEDLSIIPADVHTPQPRAWKYSTFFQEILEWTVFNAKWQKGTMCQTPGQTSLFTVLWLARLACSKGMWSEIIELFCFLPASVLEESWPQTHRKQNTDTTFLFEEAMFVFLQSRVQLHSYSIQPFNTILRRPVS